MHHFESDPDPDLIGINMEIRIRISIKTIPIHNTGIITVVITSLACNP
jgi:hypothetical protein